MNTRFLKTRLLGAGLALFALTAPALAHDDATLAAMKTPHGGQMKMAGGWHFELVQKAGADNTLIVYVTDHGGNAVPTAGYKGSATVLAGKEKLTVSLSPDGDNRLKGQGRYDVKASPKIVIAVSGGGVTEQARFTPAP